MYIDATFTREDVAEPRGYWPRLARGLLDTYPGAQRVLIARRGRGMDRVHPEYPTDIVYVASTGGRWGKSTETRLGHGVGPSVHEMQRRLHDAASACQILACAISRAASCEYLARASLLPSASPAYYRTVEARDTLDVACDALIVAGLEHRAAMYILTLAQSTLERLASAQPSERG